MHTLPIVLALLGCLRPEEGIDRTRVLGTVRVDPTVVAETANGLNGENTDPLPVEALAYGYQTLTGSIKVFDTTEDGEPTDDTDTDCWSLVTPVGRGISTEEGALGPVEIDVTLGDLAASARVSVYNRDVLDSEGPSAQPTLVTTLDVTGWNLITVPLEAKVNYSLCIAGLEGTGEVAYDLVLSAQHPDLAKILVGVYENDDPNDRGALLGGTTTLPFRSIDRWSFIAPYEMLFLREFETDTDGEVVVLDENIKEGYVFAGTWANLSQGLPAGTWYSGEPLLVDFTKKSDPEQWGVLDDTGAEDTAALEYWEPPGQPTYPTVRVEETVVVDTIAPIVIGQQIAEVEPNDLPNFDPVTEGDLAQDLGTLSGPGFVDVLDGSVATLEDYDWFKFRLPEPLEVAFTLEWADVGNDLDIIMYDGAGTFIDYGYYNFPEINGYGTGVLQPDTDYFILVYNYAGADDVAYTLKLEQLAP